MFQVVSVKETILQGYSTTKKRTVYLFKSDKTGNWAYWDKDNEKVVDVEQWEENKAWVDSEWVPMSKYHRIELRFVSPVTYTAYQDGKEVRRDTLHAEVAITDTAFKTLVEQMNGRDENSVYKMCFRERKRPKGRGMMRYVEKFLWVGTLEG